MEYLTFKEIVQKWSISARRVTTLCKTERIDGAIQKGGIWLILGDAQKSESQETGEKIKQHDEFYTHLTLIENKLKQYREFFREKIVLCNCDDPYESNFLNSLL